MVLPPTFYKGWPQLFGPSLNNATSLLGGAPPRRVPLAHYAKGVCGQNVTLGLPAPTLLQTIPNSLDPPLHQPNGPALPTWHQRLPIRRHWCYIVDKRGE